LQVTERKKIRRILTTL